MLSLNRISFPQPSPSRLSPAHRPGGVLTRCSNAVAQKIFGAIKLQLRRFLLIAVSYSYFQDQDAS